MPTQTKSKSTRPSLTQLRRSKSGFAITQVSTGSFTNTLSYSGWMMTNRFPLLTLRYKKITFVFSDSTLTTFFLFDAMKKHWRPYDCTQCLIIDNEHVLPDNALSLRLSANIHFFVMNRTLQDTLVDPTGSMIRQQLFSMSDQTNRLINLKLNARKF